jgi:N-acetylmuramoyl-L-alanine amidase
LSISAILLAVRNFLSALFVVVTISAACVFTPLHAAEPSPLSRPGALQAAQQTPAPGQVAPQPPQAPPAAPQPNAAPEPTPPSPPLPIIVLDPGHGGTDTGARGENGLAEKDVVLQIARTLEAQLITHGYHVVMTRGDDSNPSYDDRATIANAYRNAIFITLHVGSSGKMGTVWAFYDQFSSSSQVEPSSSQAGSAGGGRSAGPVAKLPANTLVTWQDAQRPFVSASHRLADILQLQFAQIFSGSPSASIAVPMRDLRSIANPAVAIEISNISAPSAEKLLELSGPLSMAIEKAVDTFRHGPIVEAP